MNDEEPARKLVDLLDRGANPNLKCQGSNVTPLECATMRRKVEKMRILLERGAHITQSCIYNLLCYEPMERTAPDTLGSILMRLNASILCHEDDHAGLELLLNWGTDTMGITGKNGQTLREKT